MKRKGYVVEPLPSGRFSLRLLYHAGRKQRAGESFDSWQDADAAGRVLAAKFGLDREEGATLASYVLTPETGWLDRRELLGRRATADVRSIVRVWIEPAPFWRRPLRSIRRREVRELVLAVYRQRAEQTARNVLNVLSRMLGDALDDELVKENVARGIRLPARARSDEPWTYLHPLELEHLLALARDDERDVIAFAVGTGLRSGELRALRLADVHLGEHPHVVVRFGAPGAPTKSGKPRRVDLNGIALEAARGWLAALPAFCPENERGLMFPTPRGSVRAEGHVLGRVHVGHGVYVDRFTVLAAEAGLFDLDEARPLVWHSLRHTCASFLVSSWWGRRWSLEEVKEVLGHASITTTQRYAHLGASALRDAARATGPRQVHAEGKAGDLAAKSDLFLNRRSQVRFLPGAQEISGDRASPRSRVVLAWEVVDAVRAGDAPRAEQASLELATFVLEHAFVLDARAVLARGEDLVARALTLAERVLETENAAAPATAKAVR